MIIRVFQVPDYASAHLAAYVLGSDGVAAQAGVRHHLPYVSVRSDRDDVESLIRGLIPAAVPVNLEHLPLPLPDEVALFS